MILAAEIGMTIFGLIALIRGVITIGKGKSIYGWQARVLGLVGMSVIPLAFVIGIAFFIVASIAGIDVTQMNGLRLVWIDLLSMAIVLVVAHVLGKSFEKQKPVKKSRPYMGLGDIDPKNPYGRL